MTWEMRMRASSMATQKLYTGRPLERSSTKSPSVSVFHDTSPRITSCAQGQTGSSHERGGRQRSMPGASIPGGSFAACNVQPPDEMS